VRLTKFGHACISLDGPGGRLVIDPGGLTENAAIEGADSILITHEHFDHFAEGRVRAAARANSRLQVWTVSSVAELLTGLGSRLHVIGNGDSFTTAGFQVEAHGTWHAEVHPDIPVIANTGFLIDQRVFHPGDALTVPDKPVAALMVPVNAPWSRISDLIDWVREVSPQHALAVHDGVLNPIGIAMINGLLGENGPGINSTYHRLEPMAQTDELWSARSCVSEHPR
jgi:L-ascorbate metabolism protein UlaG (beta-lactamase superfamily)